MIKIISHYGDPDLATVFIAQIPHKSRSSPDIIEFVESRQPPIPKTKKWVLIISTMVGCPIQCKFCDAGSYYHRKLDTEEMLAQIDYLVDTKYPDHNVPVDMLKIHFARMGEPSLNDDVLKVLEALPTRYVAPGIFPSISSVVPASEKSLMWYQSLKHIKDTLYGKKFQIQFSIHTTDEKVRACLARVNRFPLQTISDIGQSFYTSGDRKITLNFALMQNIPVEPVVIAKIFSPDIFFIKMTPLNPTHNASKNHLESAITENNLEYAHQLCEDLHRYGFESRLTWGESEENRLLTNCGQLASPQLSKEILTKIQEP